MGTISLRCAFTIFAMAASDMGRCNFARADLPFDAPPVEELLVADSAMRNVIERYRDDRAALGRSNPFRLAESRYERFRAFEQSWLKAVDDLRFDELAHDAQIDWLLLRNHIEHELRDLDIRKGYQDEASILMPFAAEVIALAESRRRMERADGASAAKTLTHLGDQIEHVRAALEAGLADGHKNDAASTLPATTSAASKPAPLRIERKVVANRAARMVRELRANLREWHDFHHGYDPEFTWWATEPFEKVDRALDEYAKFLREKIVGVKEDDKKTIVGDPIGRDALLSELKFEMIPYTPEELIDIANSEFAWCRREMLRASNDLGFGDDWRQAMEHVKSRHVKPGEQPALVKELALEAIAFLDEHDLVTIPELCREIWRMEMMTAEQQRTSPFFLGGETILVAFPLTSMSHADKEMSLRGNNRHFARCAVQHELIPGHHLQGFMTDRHRPYRQVFSTPFWIEGWALYWEMLLWDKGFAKSAEDRVGMLFWRMHRCARIIFSLSFHLDRMTPQECIDFLVNEVGHERANAEAEVRRSFESDYGPLYQAAYMLGGLQIRALRRELVNSGRMSDRAFHDAILRENSIPIEMLRAILMEQPVTKDLRTAWRFSEAQ